MTQVDDAAIDLLVVAGEASGDTHAAEVVEELVRRQPRLRTFGLGGDRLAEAGLEKVADSSEISVVGLTEVLRVLPRAKQIFRALLEEVDRRQARTALLVDFPEFNLRLAKALKERGVSVLYYVSPQIWAWRRGRVRAIAERVDRMLVLFPFEKEFYSDHAVDVVHVGHPIVDQVPEIRRPEPERDDGAPLKIALLPGSRRSEVRTHLPVMADAVARLQQDREVEPCWIRAGSLDREEFTRALPRGARQVSGVGRFEQIAAADIALCASGTATLEVGLLGTPMVVVYRISTLTYLLGRWLVDLPHISLVNLVLGRGAVPERVQGRATGAGLAAELEEIVDDPRRLARMRRDLSELRTRLGRSGASRRAADEIEPYLERETA